MGKTKFNVSKDKAGRTYDGIVFDSAMEMKYYQQVILPGIEEGKIKSYERQKRYILQPSFIKDGKKVLAIEYKADFYVRFSDGGEMVVDVKGCADAQAKMKRKMFWFVYPQIDYRWVCYSRLDGGWVDYEDVQRGRKERRKQKQIKIKENKDE